MRDGDQPMATAVVRRPLLIMTVYFGPLPPWLPLTLHSMASNSLVQFVVVTDAPPPAVLPPNVRFFRVTYAEMQQRLAALTGGRVEYTNTYKANDIKPLLPALYPDAFLGYDWWGWADLDVVFGDLLKFLALAEPHPACCRGLEMPCNKRARRDRASVCYNSSRPQIAADTYFDRRACTCTNGEVVTAVSPLYPNPWRKKCWGPFTLFRSSIVSHHGLRLFLESPKWREIVATPEYTHFDEWWGPFVQRGYESMGDVMTRLSDEGRLVMSRTWLPFSEAKSCADIECTFCPCGATRMRLDGRTLIVNDEESMILHLGESKHNWARAALVSGSGAGARWDAEQSFGGMAERTAALASRTVSDGPWALPAYTPRAEGATEAASTNGARAAKGNGGRACYDVLHLGTLSEDGALAHIGGAAVAATRYARHRPLSSRAAASIVYFSRNGSEASRRVPPLHVRPCADSSSDAGGDTGGGVGGGTSGGNGERTPSAEGASRTHKVLTELAGRYEAFTASERARTLEWLCAWQRLSGAYRASLATVDELSSLARRLPGLHGNRRVRTPMYGGERLGWWRQTVNMSDGARNGPCHATPPVCSRRRWPELEGSGPRGRRSRAARHGHASAALHGRALRAVRARRVARYDLNTPPVPGVPCLPIMDGGALGSSTVEEAQQQIFATYLQLQHVQRAEVGRTQRWMCSWLYLLRACDDAERAQRSSPVPLGRGRCRAIEPPNHAELAGLGWRGHSVTALADLAPLLFQFRCW